MLSNRTLFASALLTSAFALAGFAFAAPAKPAYTVLHQFAGAPGDGAYSYSDVALDDSGNLYGTTHNGGAHDVGAIYKLAPGGAETLLHSFVLGDNKGYNPYGGITVDQSTGDLYGTTEFGGASDAGVIWKLAADGTYSLLHTFDDTHDGRQPRWHMVRDRKGNFYGVALFGGAHGDGTVFKLATDGTFTLLHTFSGCGREQSGRAARSRSGRQSVWRHLHRRHAQLGNRLQNRLRRNVHHALLLHQRKRWRLSGRRNAARQGGEFVWRRTASGGDGYGTLFRLAPDGTLTTLYTFTDGKDGGAPFGDLLRVLGKLYGTTTMGAGGDCQNGCGTVFEFTPGGRLKTLHRFTGGTVDGGQADAGLTEGPDGALYGATPYYGVAGDGVVFSLTKK